MIFTVPVPVDHDVFGPQILMQHFHAVEGAQPFGDLFDDPAHRFQRRVSDGRSSIASGLAFDEFGDDIQKVALAASAGRALAHAGY